MIPPAEICIDRTIAAIRDAIDREPERQRLLTQVSVQSAANAREAEAAWRELRAIRELVGCREGESAVDGVRRLVAAMGRVVPVVVMLVG